MNYGLGAAHDYTHRPAGVVPGSGGSLAHHDPHPCAGRRRMGGRGGADRAAGHLPHAAARGPQGTGYRGPGTPGAGPGLLRQRADGARPGADLSAHGHAGGTLRLRGGAARRRRRPARARTLAPRPAGACAGRPHRRLLRDQLPHPRRGADPGRQPLAVRHGRQPAQGAQPVSPQEPGAAGAHPRILRRAHGHLRRAQGARPGRRRGPDPQAPAAPVGRPAGAGRAGAGRRGRRHRCNCSRRA
ncbi:Uncharacterised protein [Bordetella pertussis]|nr:Uncharacterised protein [Bordetella pertussis]